MSGRLAGVALAAWVVGCSQLPTVVDGGAPDAGGRAPRVVRLRSYADHTCAVDDAMAVWCWGRDDAGQLGDGRVVAGVGAPTRVPGVRATDVWTGPSMTCAACDDGALRCWGRNDWGQAGDGARDSPRLAPTVVRGVGRAVAVAIGEAHACAVRDDHAMRCWGWDGYGGLGAGELNAPQPVTPMLATPATAITGGAQTVCALAEATAWCWGARDDGRVGDGRVTPAGIVARLPRPVDEAATVVGLAVGDRGGCALLDGGAVRCWGPNLRGEVGDGTLEARWGPSAPAVTADAVALYAGAESRFARMADGRVLGWGAGTSGEMGAERVDRARAAEVFAALRGRVVEVAPGRAHTCLRLDDGSVRCVGDNGYGQVGVGVVGGATVDAPTEPRWP